jgi:sigma-B regulation protein RsbU (phosphoserine phosphatase)
MAAKTIDNSKRKLNSAKRELEMANSGLKELNSSLRLEQSMADIEMELAHDIQAALFPARPPVVEGWDIAFISRPRSGVSGDFYDFYTDGDILEGLSLFDVSGHGVAPALITILSKPVLFRNFKKLSSGKTAGIIDAANSDLVDQLEDINTYITGILLRMRDNNIEYVNAGHPDLLLMRNSSGSVKVVTDPECRFKGKPIGISSHKSQYCSLRFSVSPGDSILIFTDGLTEGRNCSGLSFGRERIEIAFAETYGMSASGSIDHIMKRFGEFTNGEPASDDITVIIARRI